MKAVRYTQGKPNFTRRLRVSDLAQLRLPHDGVELCWSPDNNFTIEMSDRLSDSLVERFPREFVALGVQRNEAPPEPEISETPDSNQLEFPLDISNETPVTVDKPKRSSTRKRSTGS